jgi:GNAT superfamily N-acetyltransferase
VLHRGAQHASLRPVSEELRIENASLDDLPELTELLFDLFSQEADFFPDREKQMRGLRLILEQPSRGRIFVLRGPQKIVGMINLLITISTAEGGFVLILEDLVIHKDHRHQGYGGKLLEHAIEFAKSKNFLRITLLTDKPNDQVKHFYLSHGFVESGMIPMRLYFGRDGN